MSIITENEVVPKLRFKEFSENWIQLTFNEISKEFSYGTGSAATKYDGENKYLRITDIDDETRMFKPKPLTSPNCIIEDKYKLKEDDIVFARTGASVGKSYLYNNCDGNLIYAGFLIKMSVNSADSSFIFYETLREKYYKWVSVCSVRSGQPGLNAEELKSYKLYLPNLIEQKKIALFISAVDEKLQQLSKKKELLEDYKKGIMQKIFSQEIRFKDDNGNDYTDWETKSLVDIGNIKAGGDVNKLNFSKSKTELHKFPVYSNSLSNDGLYGYSDVPKINSECVTVTGRGFLGHAIARKKNFTPIIRLLTITPKSPTSTYFLKTAINLINILVESTGIPQLTSPQLSSYKISIPSFKEQIKISNFLISIDGKIEYVSIQIDKTKQFKKGLIQQMFV